MTTTITALELTEIIAQHGGETVCINGNHPESFSVAAELELDGTEVFEVVENYGYSIQFHLVSEDMRAIVTTGLKGKF